MENSITALSRNLHKRTVRLMGNIFEITALAEQESSAAACIDASIAEMQRIEKLLTTFAPDSQTNKINANAGIQPVHVDLEVFHLIQRSLRISELTQGAFDITYGSIDRRFWNFDVSMTTLPDRETAKKKRTSYQL